MSQGDGTTNKALRFQWPITRASRVPAYDSALNDWLDDLAKAGDPDAQLTVAEFKHQINQADYRATNWEKRYYALRAMVIMLAAAVTALAGASTGISGTAGLAIKIVTAVLSFVVAATTGILELLRASNRWALYRILRNNLFQAAWQLEEPPAGGTDSKKKAEILKERLGEAVSDFEHQYLTQVLISEKPDSAHGSRR
jgi:Protein of unknown function (DUF4231)